MWLVSKSEGVNESVYGSSAATAHKYHCISLRGIHCIAYDQPGRRVYYIVVSPNTIKLLNPIGIIDVYLNSMSV